MRLVDIVKNFFDDPRIKDRYAHRWNSLDRRLRPAITLGIPIFANRLIVHDKITKTYGFVDFKYLPPLGREDERRDVEILISVDDDEEIVWVEHDELFDMTAKILMEFFGQNIDQESENEFISKSE